MIFSVSVTLLRSTSINNNLQPKIKDQINVNLYLVILKTNKFALFIRRFHCIGLIKTLDNNSALTYVNWLSLGICSSLQN